MRVPEKVPETALLIYCRDCSSDSIRDSSRDLIQRLLQCFLRTDLVDIEVYLAYDVE